MIRGGWTGLLTLRENGIDSVFLALNKTSHLSAHEDFFDRSWLRVFDALSGESTIIYRLVSSPKSRIVDWMSFTMSFISMRNKSGPNIEPWGTPAVMLTQSDAPSGKTTLCLRPLK